MQFAVMFGARANSGIDRMKIINAVAKSVPGPHKVDLNNPDKTIIVEIVKVRISFSLAKEELEYFSLLLIFYPMFCKFCPLIGLSLNLVFFLIQFHAK